MTNEKTKIFEFPGNEDYKIPEFQDCDIEQIPRIVHEQIDEQRRFDEVKNAVLLRKPLMTDFAEAGKVFLLAYYQQSMAEGYQSKHYAVYGVDVSQSGELMGSGLSLLELDESNHAKGEPPFVQYTRTQESSRNQGLAIRRLIVLNEANKALFKMPLTSGMFASGDQAAEAAWQHLVAKNFAVQDEHGGYRFIK
ncbi:MAG: hypothetical protein WEC17_02055 [Candidatus Saccharimonadales bacterium]